MQKGKILFFLLFFSFISTTQENIDTAFSIQNIHEIVVTGSFTPQTARQSVYQIRTINNEIIKQRALTRIQDILATETNIRFNQDLATGNSNMSMQGLAGQNIKILIDGVPMVGRQGTNNEINLNQIDINTIQRIEIVEGPMSVIYGADALAGVINIITKKTVRGKSDLQLRIMEESVGTSYGWPAGNHQYAIHGGHTQNDFTIKANAALNQFGGYKGTATGRDFQWHPKLQYMGGILLGIEKTRWTSHYRLDYTNENIFNPGIPTSNVANDQNYFTNRWMHQWQSDWKINQKARLTTSLAYTHFSRQVQATTFNTITSDRRLSIASGSQDTTVFNGFSFRNLLPIHLTNQLSLLPGIDINYETGTGGRLSNGTHSILDIGFIATGDIKITDRFSLKPGLRFVYNSIYQAPPVIPSLNIKYDLSPKQNIKLAYGRGFRAPSLRELYFSFFDSNHAVIGNTDLKAELSHSISGSWNTILKETDDHKVDLSINAFYNTINNLINFGQSPGNALEVTYINIDHYKTQGIATNFQSKTKALNLLASIAYTGRYNQFNETDVSAAAFLWSPEASLSATYTHIKSKTSVGLFQKYTGKTPYFESTIINGSPVIRQFIFEDYAWTDLTISKSFGDKFSLGTGIKNLFNIKQINSNSTTTAGIHTPGNNQAIGYGRSFFLNLNYTIQ